MNNSINKQDRVLWLDTVKGATIIMVVIHHSYLAYLTIPSSYTLIDKYLALFNSGASHIRMSTFFLTSGVIFSLVRKEKYEWFFRKRLPFMTWLILVWTFISFISERVGLHLYPWESFPYLSKSDIFFAPYGNVWFIYTLLMLSFFFTIIYKLNTVNKIALSILFSFLAHLYLKTSSQEYHINTILIYNLSYKGIPFFLLGSILTNSVLHYSKNIKIIVITSMLMLFFYIIFNYLLELEHGYEKLLFQYTPGTLAFLGILIFLSNFVFVSKVLSKIGSCSLEIFLIHQFFIAISIKVIIYGEITINSDFYKLIIIFLPVLSCLGFVLISVSFIRPILFTPPKFWSIARWNLKRDTNKN